MIRLCRNAEIRPLLEERRGDEKLCNRLFGNTVVTLTGRIRGGVSYSQCRNTPFQGLAADGAKLGLWRLVREGYRVIGFVHDEVLVELPDEGGWVSRHVVDRIIELLCSEMQAVLGGELPVDCEAALSTCWSKDAKLIERDGKIFPWRPEMSEGVVKSGLTINFMQASDRDDQPARRRSCKRPGVERDGAGRLDVRRPDHARWPEGCSPGGQRERRARRLDRPGPAGVRLLRSLREPLWSSRGYDREHAGLPVGRFRDAAGRLLCRGGQRRAPDLGGCCRGLRVPGRVVATGLHPSQLAAPPDLTGRHDGPDY